MKKIIYTFFVLLLSTHIAIAQTTLMSDEDHRTMMNDYAVNLNSVLTSECPQSISIDQFKKKIVNGELTLSSTAQASILSYAAPLIACGTQFATAKNLTATTDAEKIFLSSFAPSTLVDSSGYLIESTTGGITAVDMWTCSLDSFYTGQCGINAIVSDKNDVKVLTNACTTLLMQNSGLIGVLVIIDEYGDCIDLEKLKKEITIKDNRIFFETKESFTSAYQALVDESDEKTSKYFNNLYENGFISLRPIVTESNEKLLYDNFLNLLSSKQIDISVNNDEIFDHFDYLEQIIGDDLFAAFLNSDSEIQIADTIYKYTDVGLFFSKEDKFNNLLLSLEEKNISFDITRKTSDSAKQQIISEYPNGNLSSNDISYFKLPYVELNEGNNNLFSRTSTDPNYVFLDNLNNCNPSSGTFGNFFFNVFGDNNVCIDKYENRRRVKTKAFNFDYFLVYHLGVKCVHQRRGWTLFWRVEKTDEIRLIVEAAQFEYDLDKLSGNTIINNNNPMKDFYLNNQRITYGPNNINVGGQYGFSYSNLNHSSLPEIFQNTGMGLTFEFSGTGLTWLDNQIQNGINSGLNAKKLNDHFYSTLYDQATGLLRIALNDNSYISPANRTFAAKFPENGKIIVQKAVVEKGFGIGVRKKTFDWGGQIKINASQNGDNSWSIAGGQSNILTLPKKLRIKIIGAARRGDSWHGSKFNIGIDGDFKLIPY